MGSITDHSGFQKKRLLKRNKFHVQYIIPTILNVCIQLHIKKINFVSSVFKIQIEKLSC